MNFTTDRKEQYAVLTLKEDSIDGDVPESLETDARMLLQEGYNNLILVMDQATDINEEGVVVLRKLVRLCSTKLGTLVVATESDDFSEVLDQANIGDLLVLPTLEEAIDAVFMHDLENEFGAGDDDYDDDDYHGISEMDPL